MVTDDYTKQGPSKPFLCDVFCWSRWNLVNCWNVLVLMKIIIFCCLLVNIPARCKYISQRQIWSDNCMCCHSEIEVEDQTGYLTQSQYTDTRPTNPNADPIMPGAGRVATGVPVINDSTQKKVHGESWTEPQVYPSWDIDMASSVTESGLIMGVHPGCPVCLIVAASHVAVEMQCGRNNLCHKSRIWVSLVCWSCAPFCRPFSLLLHSLASLPVSWGVGSECFSTTCGRLQGPPRTQCWCQVLLCLFCRYPCSAAVGDLWISFQMPTLHRECLLGCPGLEIPR